MSSTTVCHPIFARLYDKLSVVAVTVEPEPHQRANAVEAATSTTIRVTVIDATATELPHENATFDAALYSLVLCASPTPPRRSLTSNPAVRFT